MNQVEIWFSILARKLLRRGNFTSLSDLSAKVLHFISYFNSTSRKVHVFTKRCEQFRRELVRITD